MMLSGLSLPLLTLATAQADLLYLGIRGANEESVSLARRLDAELNRTLGSREQLTAQRVDPEVCRAMTMTSCLLDQGLDHGVGLALGGEVIDGAERRILLSLVDVGSEDLVFTVELVALTGPAEGLGDDLVQLLIGVVTEDVVPLEELRLDMGEAIPAEEWDAVEGALQHRLPERWELRLKNLLEPVALEKIAVADVDRSKLPPWQQLGMEPDEYGLFQASGMSIEEWRDEYGDGSWVHQVQGRQGQVIIRPVLGVGLSAHSTLYEGWYMQEGSPLAWTASSAWHGRTAGPGADLALWLGFGLSKNLELDIGVGLAPTTYTTRVQLEIPGDTAYDPQENETTAMDLAFGVRLLAAPRPMQDLRPVFGGGIRTFIGPGTPSNNQPTESAFMEDFSGSRLGFVEAIGGLEYTTEGGLDLTAWVPVGLGLLGHDGDTFNAGEVDRLTADMERSNPWLSIGIELGLGIRKGGG